MASQPRIVEAIIILGAPRSGTTILQRCLALHPDLWHLPGESHRVLEGPFHPAQWGYESNRVAADDVDEDLAQQLRRRFYHLAINLNKVWANPAPLLAGNTLFERASSKVAAHTLGKLSQFKKPEVIRFLEKTPKNTLRIPMLTRLFPHALYVWLKRSAAANIDSLMAGWHAEDKIGPFSRRRYGQAGYPIADQLELLDYRGKWWKFTLVPGWRNLKGRTIADVATWQYYQCNRYLLDDLAGVDACKVLSVHYEEFVRTPTEVIRRIFAWADLPPSRVAEEFARILPRVNAVSPAAPRSKNGLRYPDRVFGAIERLPAIGLLQRMMGYEAETI
jgi:hypothetical protein